MDAIGVGEVAAKSKNARHQSNARNGRSHCRSVDECVNHRAFVPPCGFSEAYNCPLPPAQNRLAVPVEAGEKVPVFTNDFSI